MPRKSKEALQKASEKARKPDTRKDTRGSRPERAKRPCGSSGWRSWDERNGQEDEIAYGTAYREEDLNSSERDEVHDDDGTEHEDDDCLFDDEEEEALLEDGPEEAALLEDSLVWRGRL